MLEGGDEREPDRLLLDRRVGRVGRRLDPGDLGGDVEVLEQRLARRAEIHRSYLALLAAQHVETDVGGDPVQPRLERRPAFEAVEAFPRTEHRLLHRILRLER